MKTLNEDEFDFSDYVSNQDENNCGTICCVLGWFPKWFPNSGVKWVKSFGGIVLNHGLHSEHILQLTGFSKDLSTHLFQGSGFSFTTELQNFKFSSFPANSSLTTVIEKWEEMLEFLKTNQNILEFPSKYSLT